MRSLLLSLLCLGLATPACAQPPDTPAPAPRHDPAPASRSPIGAAMSNLSRALHDAAEQARHPTTATASATPAAPPSPPAERPSQPQPTEQVALP